MKKNYIWKVLLMTGGVLTLVGAKGIFAYFSDQETTSNQFTVGSVEIDLKEPAWEAKADTDQDGIPDEAEFLVPRQVVTKDPQVTNTGKNDAFVFLTVEVPCKNILTVQDNGMLNEPGMTNLFSYNVHNTWQLAGVTKVINQQNEVTHKKYLYAYADSNKECTVLKPNEVTNPLFSSVMFANVVEGQGLENSIQKMNITAYGIQADNLGIETKNAAAIWSIISNQNQLDDNYVL